MINNSGNTPDFKAIAGGVDGYIGRSKEIFNDDFLNLGEDELEKLQAESGFSFPTNEGMRKITKDPEIEKIDQDPSLSKLTSIIRATINGVGQKKDGGVYFGVNAFHHGHLAFLSKSESIVSIDMNKLVPYGFGFIVGLTSGAKRPEDFKNQVAAIAANPEILKDFFKHTKLGDTVLVQSDSPQAVKARKRLLEGLLSTMNEFDPFLHGQRKVPPVFCHDRDAYDYFRTLVIQDKIAGGAVKLQSQRMIGILAKSLEAFQPILPEINTLYVSSCFDPRFLGAKERKKFIGNLSKAGHKNIQIVESFLNSGWIVYDIQ